MILTHSRAGRSENCVQLYTDEGCRADKVPNDNDNRQFDRLDLRVRDGTDGMGPRTGHAAARVWSLKKQQDLLSNSFKHLGFCFWGKFSVGYASSWLNILLALGILMFLHVG